MQAEKQLVSRKLDGKGWLSIIFFSRQMQIPLLFDSLPGGK